MTDPPIAGRNPPPDSIDAVRDSVRRHLDGLAALSHRADALAALIQAIRQPLRAGGRVFTCGNGGSAAEALHLAEEMIGRFRRERAPLPAVCLAADPTALTCIANDYGYEQVFARQLEGLGRPGDVLVALSTSGRSPSIVRALETARRLGIATIGLLGPPGSPAEPHCDQVLTLPGVEPAVVQEAHLIVVHLILERIDG